MNADAGVRELLKIIFGKKPTIPEELVGHSSIPSSLLDEDFSERLTVVFKWRKRVVYQRWNHFFDQNKRDMFTSPRYYLGSVVFACVFEHESNPNIFDSFISVCALLSHLNEETLSKVRLDFRNLSPDIIMVIYRHVLKRSSLNVQEFNQFVEYIRGHKYLEWQYDDDFDLCDDLTASLPYVLDQKIKEELNRYCYPSDVEASTMQATAAYLLKEILVKSSAKLPKIPSEAVLIRRLIASEKKMKKKAIQRRRGEIGLTAETSHGNSSRFSDSQARPFVNRQKDPEWHENIIKAVIRHNHSKNAAKEMANNQIHEEASGILEHLGSKIKSLIEVLDNYS